MADERYFAGNTLAAFKRTSTAVVEITTAGRFDSSFVANGISVGGIGDYFETSTFIDAANVTTLWTHFEIYAASFSGIHSVVEWVNSTAVPVAKLTMSSGVLQFSYWNGSAFVTYGAAGALTAGVLTRFDIKLTAGASGTFNLYKGGTLHITDPGTGMNAAFNNIAVARFGSQGGSGSGHIFSQVLGANFDTRDSRYMQNLANANGADTDGTGTYTDINETVLDESTAIVLATVGHKKTFTKPAITLPAGYRIAAAWVNGRARVTGGTIADGQLIIRSGGTDYMSASKAYNTGYEPRGHYLLQNPNGTIDWTQTSYNNAEFGIKAV
jgi:hypothetical protein